MPDELVGNPGDGWKQVTSELAFERSGPERLLSTFPPARGDTGRRFEREAAAETSTAELWELLEETGLTLAGIDEAAGGTGGGLPEAAAVIRLAAKAGARVPAAWAWRDEFGSEREWAVALGEAAAAAGADALWPLLTERPPGS